ncbi:DUF4856 domain-containing protein [Croceiramulus getboli]|nr:DUF4856 domain-containing protein [Flavobacteriaceae bacterium YJPT1-3]
MNLSKFALISGIALSIVGCSSDDDATTPTTSIETPASYSFERNGASTVSFSGQTTRILMAEDINSSLLDFDQATAVSLTNKFANENDPFDEEALNTSGKSIKSKTAASADYFTANSALSAAIKADLESFLTLQVEEVFPAQMTSASAGNPGQIDDGSSTRYVNAKGLEYNQAFVKSLIGALMTDQALNNYLSVAVLDEGMNREENDNGITAAGENYTVMEHKWDEAYGYVYGTAPDAANPMLTIGQDDSYLNKYIGRVEGDEDYAGIAQDIFNAFALGRAAIVAGDYELRDQQADVIRDLISKIIGIRAVYYLQQAKVAFAGGETGSAFHDLSEGYGFIYSLQFTRDTATDAPYFTKAEVDAFLGQLMEGNGFWDVEDATLDTISASIAARFNLNLEEAAN